MSTTISLGQSPGSQAGGDRPSSSSGRLIRLSPREIWTFGVGRMLTPKWHLVCTTAPAVRAPTAGRGYSLRAMNIARLLLLAGLVLTDSAARALTPIDIEAETRAWQKKRIEALTSDDGWLTLVGLYWLSEGKNPVGSDKGSAVVLPAKAPAQLGTFVKNGENVTLELKPGVTLLSGDQLFTGGPVHSDASEQPDVLRLGTLRLLVIKRGEKIGVRIKDSQADARRAFHAIPTYPANAKWRIEARFEPAAGARAIAVPTVLGTVEQMSSPGSVIFSVDGKEYRLDPVVEPGENRLFFIFGDQTNKTETYGAGRFLYAEMPVNGRVVLDFNRAYNPPCAFSPYATCPLPPRQNKLALRVEAGEKRYGNH